MPIEFNIDPMILASVLKLAMDAHNKGDYAGTGIGVASQKEFTSNGWWSVTTIFNG